MKIFYSIPLLRIITFLEIKKKFHRIIAWLKLSKITLEEKYLS